MKSNIVLLAEDNVDAATIKNTLAERYNFEIIHTMSITGAHFILTEEIGIENIGLILLDLNLPIPTSKQFVEDVKEFGIDYSNNNDIFGWEYASKFLFKKYPEDKKKIIFYTAYYQRLKALIGEEEILNYKIINKAHGNMLDKLDEYLLEL